MSDPVRDAFDAKAEAAQARGERELARRAALHGITEDDDDSDAPPVEALQPGPRPFDPDYDYAAEPFDPIRELWEMCR